jgi:hypothetical protein
LSIQRFRATAVAIFLGTALGLSALVYAVPARTSSTMAHEAHTSSKLNDMRLGNELRKLWEDHITWTRMFIVGAIAELPDTSAAAERLLQNQDDIGDAIKPFYGERAGEKLSKLLRGHILIAADLLQAAKEGDSEAVSTARARWYDNADAIARFLGRVNPENWPHREMRAMMREHLALTLEEATARLQGHWRADIVAYDRIHRQALHMADMMSGIIRQFPERF